jgi:hypothetical protein
MSHKAAITGDAAQVVALLAWAKTEGVGLTHVTVGGCHVDVAVTAPARSPEDVPRRPERPSLYKEFGGAAYDQMTADADAEAGEMHPVVGRTA